VESELVDWVLIFEQSYAQVVSPINRFRNIVLACVFLVMGAIVLVTFSMAHYAVRPIGETKFWQ
jgi:osomolarity two-component system, sensor histidine kinase SLN1